MESCICRPLQTHGSGIEPQRRRLLDIRPSMVLLCSNVSASQWFRPWLRRSLTQKYSACVWEKSDGIEFHFQATLPYFHHCVVKLVHTHAHTTNAIQTASWTMGPNLDIVCAKAFLSTSGLSTGGAVLDVEGKQYRLYARWSLLLCDGDGW